MLDLESLQADIGQANPGWGAIFLGGWRSRQIHPEATVYFCKFLDL